MNTTVNAWMLHDLECPCLKCSTYRDTHRACLKGRPCGLQSCYERLVLLQDGELLDEPLVPAPLVP